MLRRAVTARTGRQHAEEIDLGEEFQVVAGPHRAGLHEVLAGVAGEAGAHENVEHVMDMRLGFGERGAGGPGKGAGEVGMATMVILPAMTEKVVRVRVAARSEERRVGTAGVSRVRARGAA